MHYFKFRSVDKAAEARKACGVPSITVGLMLVCELPPYNQLVGQSSSPISDDQREQLNREWLKAYPVKDVVGEDLEDSVNDFLAELGVEAPDAEDDALTDSKTSWGHF